MKSENHELTGSFSTDNRMYHEILQSERDKTTLLALSEQISKIRRREELFIVISKGIQFLFQYHECSLYVKDNDSNMLKLWCDNFQITKQTRKIIEDMKKGQPLNGNVAKNTLIDRAPFVLSRDTMINSGKEGGAAYVKATAIQECMVGPLRAGNEILGCLNITSLKSGHFTDNHIALYKSVCAQLGIAIWNIISNEEIIKREQEKSTLLSLSESMSKVRTRKGLWDLTTKAIKPIFNFEDAVITQIDWKKLEYSVMVFNSPDYRSGEKFAWITTQSIPLENTAYQGVVEKITKEGPSVFSTAKLGQSFRNDEVVKILGNLGISETLFSPLFSGDRLMGTINFHYGKGAGFDPGKLSLIKSLSDLVSLSVANILANEEILQREREKSLLLSLSEALSEVRQKEDLINVILDKIKAIIPFDDMPGIFVVDDTIENYYIYFNKFYDDVVPNSNSKNITIKTRTPWMSTRTPINSDPVAQKYCSGEKVHVSKLSEWIEKLPGHPGVKIAAEFGFLETLHIQLTTRGKLLGLLSLNAFKEGTFAAVKPEIAKSIGELVSNALANILANEEITDRDREKSILLSISNDFATIKCREDLFATLNKKILPLFGCTDLVVFIINRTNDTYYLLEGSGEKDRYKNGNVPELTSKTLRYSGSVEEWIIKKGGAAIVSFAEFEKCFFNDPGIRLMREVGLKDSIVGSLMSAGDIIGSLHLHSGQDNFFNIQQLPLFKSIANQIAVAVANILANEEILQREREKSLLLSLSTAIANITNKYLLWEEIVNHLQPVFRFERDYTFLYLLTPDKKHYRFFLISQSSLSNGGLAFRDVLNKQFPVRGFPYEKAITKPVWIFDIAEEQKNYPDFWGFKESLKHGSRYTAIIRLEIAGEVIGTLHLNSLRHNSFNQTQIPLLESIGKQVSIAVANIVANEEITNHLAEITQLKRQLEAENEYLQEEVETAYNFDEIIGSSDEMQKVYNSVSLVACTDSTVLLLGETGTGKELIARAIHNTSKRKSKLLVKVNCATLPANLIESELFGHERGSFTGATERRIGKFELANNGTLFLDEIGELPIELQAKLLRALQEKEIERIGGKTPIKCDVRIIAATNRNLEDEVKKHNFRNDLFFRLNIFPIKLPPLRERKEDIPLLADHFLQKFTKKIQRKITNIDADTIKSMMLYHWPGNIRELENVIERAVIINKTKTLKISVVEYGQKEPSKEMPSAKNQIFQIKSYQDAERELILKTLEICNGKIRGEGGAAELLKIKPTTLESKMKKLGLVKKTKVEIE